MQYNGGSVIAMAGKDCVAVASDLRLGNQALTIGCNFEKVGFTICCLRNMGVSDTFSSVIL